MTQGKMNTDALALLITADALQTLPPRPRRFGLQGIPLREQAQIAYEQQLYRAASARAPKQMCSVTDFRTLAAGCSQAHTRDMHRTAQRASKNFTMYNRPSKSATAVGTAMQP
ncbi:TPA: hypothetical protein ACH3X2_009180 [Trebouxia sp. C0005]